MLPNKSIKEDRSDREIDYMLSEKESCKVFLKEYNKKNKVDYRFTSLGDPIKKEPSCICTDDLSIEIAPVYYNKDEAKAAWGLVLSLIHISEPTRLGMISYAVFCLKKKNKKKKNVYN